MCVYIQTCSNGPTMGVVEISIRALLPHTARIIYLALTESYHLYLYRDWRSLASFLKAINPPADLYTCNNSNHGRTAHTILCTNKIFFAICFVSNLFAGVLFLSVLSRSRRSHHYLFGPRPVYYYAAVQTDGMLYIIILYFILLCTVCQCTLF